MIEEVVTVSKTLDEMSDLQITEQDLIQATEKALEKLEFKELVEINAAVTRLIAFVKEHNPRIQFSRSQALIFIAAYGLNKDRKRFGDALEEARGRSR